MVTIDGGAGGGQLLRTALSLAAVTGRSVTIEDVRGARDDPGLRPQHRAGVDVVADLTDAAVEGATVGSTEVTLAPCSTPHGSVDVDLETAGSLSLLFETVLSLGVASDAPIAVTATGGTDVKWSPPIAYQRHVKVPLMNRFGHDIELAADRTGFYPVGGGRATLRVGPADPAPLALSTRGTLHSLALYSKASEDLAEAEVAERQCDGVREALGEHAASLEETEVTYVETACPGTSVVLVAAYEETITGFDALGERGKPAETVGAEAAEAHLSFAEGPGSVDRHLGDQLLVPLAIAGGAMWLPAVTDHVRTNLEVIHRFGGSVAVAEHQDGGRLVTVDDPIPVTPAGP